MVTRLKRVKFGAIELGDMYEREMKKITVDDILSLKLN